MATKILNEETLSCCYWHWTGETLGQLATVTRFVLDFMVSRGHVA